MTLQGNWWNLRKPAQLSLISQAPRGFGGAYRGFPALCTHVQIAETAKLRRLRKPSSEMVSGKDFSGNSPAVNNCGNDCGNLILHSGSLCKHYLEYCVDLKNITPVFSYGLEGLVASRRMRSIPNEIVWVRALTRDIMLRSWGRHCQSAREL